MYVCYTFCKAVDYRAYEHGDLVHEIMPAEYITAWDYGVPAEWEYEDLLPNESIWIVPGTLEGVQ